MSGALSAGVVLRTRSGEPIEVVEWLGAGGQGEVYRVRTSDSEMALKWYFPAMATPGQRAIIERLVGIDVDQERFLWPIDLVLGKSPAEGFGYVMRLRPPEFRGLPDLFRRRFRVTFRTLFEASLSLVEAYRTLHSRGIAYRDISWGNVFFDPETGRALICDNDNAIFEGEAVGIAGTMVFMAPELVRGQARPSTQTDLHSLAVLLFMMLMNSHPLEGDREMAIHCLDAQAQRRLYGDEPVFVFDPNDETNRPVPGEHSNALATWPLMPEHLQRLFVEAFTTGLMNPDARVRESQWANSLSRTLDEIVYCANCGRQNLHDEAAFRRDNQTRKCWSCGNQLALPPRMNIQERVIMLNRDAVVLAHHIDHDRPREREQVIAAVTEHPSKRGLYGLTNMGQTEWEARRSDGSLLTVPSGKTVPLKNGLQLNLGGVDAEILRGTGSVRREEDGD